MIPSMMSVAHDLSCLSSDNIIYYLANSSCISDPLGVMMKKFNVPISEEVEKRLEAERRRRGFESIPETIRVVLSDYFAKD